MATAVSHDHGRHPVTDRYTSVAILFHWVIAVLVITNIGLAELTEDLTREARGPYMDTHKAIGITILFLSLGRLGWRLTHRPPPLPDFMPAWEKFLARANHVLFYVLMIGLPLGGWLWMSTYPAPFSYFGLFDVPMLPVAGQEALGDLAHEGHEVGGTVMIALIALHILGATKHHLVDKFPLLRRMLP